METKKMLSDFMAYHEAIKKDNEKINAEVKKWKKRAHMAEEYYRFSDEENVALIKKNKALMAQIKALKPKKAQKINCGLYLFKLHDADDNSKVLGMKFGRSKHIDQRQTQHENGFIGSESIMRWEFKGKVQRNRNEAIIKTMLKKKKWSIKNKNSGEWIQRDIDPAVVVEEINTILRSLK